MDVCNNFIREWDDTVALWYHKDIRGDKIRYGKLLNMDYLPEPYWGDPRECSFVIVNYNPGGGNDRNPHIFRECGNCPHNLDRMINYIKAHSYSELMLQFPGLMSKDTLINKNLEWFSDYSGYGWWQKKSDWIHHLAKSLDVPTLYDGLMPFAVELSPWHKPKWTRKDNNLLLKAPLREVVEKQVLNVIHEAVENSMSKFAIFIGKLHCDFLESFGYVKVENVITEQPFKDTKRFYRIYQQKDVSQPHCVLVTWSNGSNHHPSEKFREYESDLLKRYTSKIMSYYG